MIVKFRLPAFVLAIFIAISFSACKEDGPLEDYSSITGTYFSVRQYALDQWNTFYGEPFLIIKTVKVNNGPYDTSYTASDTLNWGNIFKTFFATEISDRKYLGKYKFTQFEDDQDVTHNFFYEALEDDLYTRKLLITVDQYTQLVKGIYIEAIDKSLSEDKVIKLYYKPMKRIQIQTTETPLLGEKVHTVTEYEFQR